MTGDVACIAGKCIDIRRDKLKRGLPIRACRKKAQTAHRPGFRWFVKTAHIEYKRALALADSCLVRTWVEELGRTDVKVGFQILRKTTGKLCCDGWFAYAMINLQTGRAEVIPDWIVAKYAV